MLGSTCVSLGPSSGTRRAKLGTPNPVPQRKETPIPHYSCRYSGCYLQWKKRQHSECYFLSVPLLCVVSRRFGADVVLDKAPGSKTLLLAVEDSELDSDQVVVFPPPV